MTATEKRVLDRFKAALQGRISVSRIVLFGSRARGDADAFSDMDLIVVIDGDVGEGLHDAVSDCAWEAGFGDGIVVVPIVLTKNEWELGSFRSSLLGRAVTQEGRAV